MFVNYAQASIDANFRSLSNLQNPDVTTPCGDGRGRVARKRAFEGFVMHLLSSSRILSLIGTSSELACATVSVHFWFRT